MSSVRALREVRSPFLTVALIIVFTSSDKNATSCFVELFGFSFARFLYGIKESAILVDRLAEESIPPSPCNQSTLGLDLLAKVMFVTEHPIHHLPIFLVAFAQKDGVGKEKGPTRVVALVTTPVWGEGPW